MTVVHRRSGGGLVRSVEDCSRNRTEMWIRHAKVDLHVALPINSDSGVYLFKLVQIRGVGFIVTGSIQHQVKLALTKLIGWFRKNVILTSAYSA